MKILRPSEFIESVTYARRFDYSDNPGSGFSFPSDASGTVDPSKLRPEGRANYLACLAGTANGKRVVDLGVVRYESTYRRPAVGKCACGREVELAHFTNTCECGADYNSAGQRLAPREQWGEETGEHWSECY